MITASFPDLARAVRLLGTVPRRVPVPILAAARLTGHGDVATLETFDYDTGAAVDFPIQGGPAVPSTVLLDRAILARALKSPGGTPVTRRAWRVTIDGAVLSFPTGATVDAGHPGVAADFPALPAGFTTRATVDRDTLATAAGPAAVCASPIVAALPILEAARVTVGNGQIVALATDRYRLADTAAGPADGDLVALIPARWLAASAKLLGPGPVAISTDGRGHVALEQDGARLFATLVEGDYPRAVEAIADTAADSPVRFTADRRALLEATRGAIAATGKNEPVGLELDGHALNVTAGASTWKIMVDGHGPWEGAFNPTFLRDALATLTGERVVLRQAMPTNSFPKAASITAAGPARFTIQPIRL
ncbi:MAG: hypothetical protein EOM10_08655 [Opitutae bacterium]|nr:hypothetical protein [Opitutae bacterium]